ncbi:hypothetical protein [Corynebacterium imitans]|uniref:hypothetical protein n=1 Tax=Corynebacterium imitans TaxID=156978 RepID=UPI0011861A63|nr:hypothetical protein [Corynebacterium imitans]
MPDSFSELRHAGGSNKPWVVGGIFALALALIGVALAGAYWSSQPGADTPPATVTVTAQPLSPAADIAPAGTYSGTFNNLRDDARRPQKAAWPVVATFGEGTAMVVYPPLGMHRAYRRLLAQRAPHHTLLLDHRGRRHCRRPLGSCVARTRSGRAHLC